MKEPRRERLLVAELHEKFPDLMARKIDNSHYYLDRANDDTVRLAYLRVDQGGTRDHIARKCEADINARAAIPSFRQLIDGDRFMITILTARETKAKLIRETLGKKTWPIRFRVDVVEELAPLITRSIDD